MGKGKRGGKPFSFMLTEPKHGVVILVMLRATLDPLSNKLPADICFPIESLNLCMLFM